MGPDDPLRAYWQAAVEGDDVAVAHLVRTTQPAVWRLCRALGSPGATDDLVQDTYLRALRSLASFRGETAFQVWLLSIARRVCADDVRRRQRARRLSDRLRMASARQVAPPHEHVDDIVAVLGEDRRDAFVLTQFLGLSYEEAAEVIGCPIGTVRSRVARARLDLAAAIDERVAR